MQLSYILENLNRFPKVDLAAESRQLSQVLDALYMDELQFYEELQLQRLVDTSRFDLYEVFDVSHATRESCVLYVATYDQKPLALVYALDNSSDWAYDLIDTESYKALARDLMSKHIDERLADIEAFPIASLHELEHQHIQLLGSKGTCFAVESPKDVKDFAGLNEKHPAYYPTDDGRMVKVDRIIGFANELHSWEGIDAYLVIVEMEGARHTVAGKRIIFELVAGQGDFEDILESLPKENRWVIEVVGAETVYIDQHYAYTSYPSDIHLKLDVSQRQAFIDQYSGKEGYPGIFSLEALGLKGETFVVY